MCRQLLLCLLHANIQLIPLTIRVHWSVPSNRWCPTLCAILCKVLRSTQWPTRYWNGKGDTCRTDDWVWLSRLRLWEIFQIAEQAVFQVQHYTRFSKSADKHYILMMQRQWIVSQVAILLDSRIAISSSAWHWIHGGGDWTLPTSFPRTRRMRVPSQQLRWDTFRSRVCCYRHCPCTLGRVSDVVFWKQVILKQNR